MSRSWRGKASALQAMGAAAALAVPALAVPAGAGASERADFAVRFAEQAPGSSTAMTLHVRYKAAGDPEAKPSPVRRVVIELPAGTGLADGVRCEAGDEDLRAHGRGACPAESQVGTGVLTAMTGVPPLDPFPTDVTLFRGSAQLIELISRQHGDETLAFERLKIEGTRLSADVAMTPGGPPDGETAARDIDWEVPRGWVVTPPVCPGAWTSRGEFTFADGVTVTESSTTPCASRPAAASGAAPLRVTPARVRAGRTVTLAVRLSASKRCRRGALVRAGGRRARTDGQGRARLRVSFARAGRHRVLAGAARCPRRSAVIVATGS